MAFTPGNDIHTFKANDTRIVGAGAGSDRYVLDTAVLSAGQRLSLFDPLGTNTLQLVGGLQVVSSQVTSNALQLTLSNGATLNVLGASSFRFQTGGNTIDGSGGLVQDFAAFVTQSLKASVPPAGVAPVQGGKVTVSPTGGTMAGEDLLSAAQAQSKSIASFGPVATSSTPYVNTLDSKVYWDKTQLTYSFNNSLPAEYQGNASLTNGWRSLNEGERTAVRSALADIDTLIAPDLQEVALNGDIRFNVAAMEAGVAAFAYYPGNSSLAGDMFLGADTPGLNFTQGAYGYSTIVHEMGHSLGLKHPFEGAAVLPAALDNTSNSIMSYTSFRNDEFIPTWNAATGRVSAVIGYKAGNTQFSLFDVHALHAAYGPEANTRTGNDTYTVAPRQFLTLWDAGGVDTINASQARGPSRVNLGDGTFSSINLQTTDDLIATALADLAAQGAPNANWIRDFVTTNIINNADILYNGENNLAIVQGAIVENLATGSGSDQVWDNAVDNHISTGAGNDTIYLGQGGFDRIDGGNDLDTIVFNVASTATQRAVQADGSLLVVGTGFAVQLVGVEVLHFTDQQITV